MVTLLILTVDTFHFDETHKYLLEINFIGCANLLFIFTLQALRLFHTGNQD
jgi:hypothetical protein